MAHVLVIVAKSKVAQHGTIHYANSENRYSVSEDLLSRWKPLEPTWEPISLACPVLNVWMKRS